MRKNSELSSFNSKALVGWNMIFATFCFTDKVNVEFQINIIS